MASIQTRSNGEVLIRTMMVLLIFSVLNGMIFMVALPDIIKEFHLQRADGSWVITIYMIIYAVGSVIYGKLTDRFQLKNLITFGLSLFALGSVLGLFTNSFAMLLIARAFQAIGAAVIPATSMIIPVRYFEPQERGRAFGITSAGISIGAAIGPIVSGLISGFAGWRFLFLFSLLPLVTIPFFRKYLEKSEPSKAKVDVLGAGLLAGTVTLSLLALTQTNLLLLAGGLVLLVLFIIRIRTAAAPFIQPKVFANSNYSLGIFFSFLTFGLNMTIPFAFPQLLAAIHHSSALEIGLLMFPAAVISALVGQLGGRLADKRGNSFLIWVAAVAACAGLLLLSTFSNGSLLVVSSLLILPYVGFIFSNVGMSNAVSQSLSRDQVGVGMGIFSMLNFIAAGAATSLAGKFLDGAPSFHLNPLISDPRIFSYGNFFLILAVLPPLIAISFSLIFRRKAALG